MVRGLATVLRMTRATDRFRFPFKMVEKYGEDELPRVRKSSDTTSMEAQLTGLILYPNHSTLLHGKFH
jgi:hypothetical protein